MTDQEAIEQSYTVLEEGVDDWGRKYDRKVLLGYALTGPASRIPFTIPKPRQQDIYLGDEPQLSQKWKRLKVPAALKREEMIRRGQDDFGGEDRWWVSHPEALGKEALQFLKMNNEYSENGMHLFINGRLTYITGLHYSYLMWSKLKDGRFPKYWDSDRRWFYVWQACLEDPLCDGETFLKHRQGGLTSKACHIGAITVTTNKNSKVVIRDSMSLEHGLGAIWNPVLKPMYLGWPMFMQPMTPEKEWNERGEMRFAAQLRRGKEKNQQSDRGLQSSIELVGASSKQSKADGMTVKFLFVDEPGKPSNVNIRGAWGTERPALKAANGKALFGSTVEEGNGQSSLTLQYAQFCYDSDRALIETNPNGQTNTGLYFYFVPCYDGLDSEWIGPFGESMVGTPSESQIEFQRERFFNEKRDTYRGDEEKLWEAWNRKKIQYDRGGAYQFILDKYSSCATDRERADVKRRFPMTPDDALMASAHSSYFNQEKILSAITHLSRNTNGKPVHDSLVRYGNFEPAEMGVLQGGMEAGRSIPKFKGDVKWVDYPKEHERARFRVSGFPESPYTPNQVHRGPARHNGEFYGIITPNNGDIFRIGFDTLEWDKKDLREPDSKLSMAAAHLKWMFDVNVDRNAVGDTEQEMIASMKSNRYLFEYLARPDNVEDIFKDIINAAIFFGAKINAEKDRGKSFQNFCKTHGLLPFLLSSVIVSPNDYTVSNKVFYGTNANHDVALPLITTFVEMQLLSPERFPFIRTLQQLLRVTVDTITKNDLVASMEMTEMAGLFPRQVVARVAQKDELAAGNGDGPEKRPTTQLAVRKFKMSAY